MSHNTAYSPIQPVKSVKIKTCAWNWKRWYLAIAHNLMLDAVVITKHVHDSKLPLKFFFFGQISLVWVKISYFSLKVGSKELNHAPTGDLRAAGEAWKGGLEPGHNHTTFSSESPSLLPPLPGKRPLCNFCFGVKYSCINIASFEYLPSMPTCCPPFFFHQGIEEWGELTILHRNLGLCMKFVISKGTIH